jgi:hypothetical protein
MPDLAKPVVGVAHHMLFVRRAVPNVARTTTSPPLFHHLAARLCGRKRLLDNGAERGIAILYRPASHDAPSDMGTAA